MTQTVKGLPQGSSLALAEASLLQVGLGGGGAAVRGWISVGRAPLPWLGHSRRSVAPALHGVRDPEILLGLGREGPFQ